MAYWDGAESVDELIFQAIGAASVMWDYPEDAGNRTRRGTRSRVEESARIGGAMTLIGPMPDVDVPRSPTPWFSDDDQVRDGNEELICEIDSGAGSYEDRELARLIAEAVNQVYGASSRKPFVSYGEEPPEGVDKLVTNTGMVIERAAGGGWWIDKTENGVRPLKPITKPGHPWADLHSHEFPAKEVLND